MLSVQQLLDRKSKAIYSVKPDDPVITAIQKMADYHVGALLVMAGDKLSDIEAGAAAGVPKLVHVATGQGLAERARVVAWRGPVAVTMLADLSHLLPCAS